MDKERAGIGPVRRGLLLANRGLVLAIMEVWFLNQTSTRIILTSYFR